MRKNLAVRSTRLDDTGAISRLFRSRIATWQRLDSEGRVEDVSYDDLSIYERWAHGAASGPWMSIETGAIWLNHLMLADVVTLVLEKEGEIAGYLEAYPGSEPKPFGRHLHIGQLIVNNDDLRVKNTLIQHLVEMAEKRADRLTAAFSGYDKAAAAYFTQIGMAPLTRIGRYALRAQTGRNFYKAVDHHDGDLSQINGWYMPVGHMQSASQQWHTMWPSLWNTIGEMQQRRVHRLHFTASGQTALMVCQQHLYDARTAEIFCWSSMPLKSQLVIAICDWAHRQNYRSLIFAVPEDSVKMLGAEYETQPQQQDIYSVEL